MGTPYGRDPAELVALRRVLGWMLAAEQGDAAAAAPDCSALEPGPLLAAVARHRLEPCLSPHAAALGFPAAVVEELRRRAGLQRLGGLALAGLARELIPRFEAAGVRVLVFKGPLLAAQTCGDLGARGSGDLDLLVDPEAVAGALAVLEGAGFRRLPGYAPRQLQRRAWRYARWAMKELPLARGPLVVDLHWALTNVRRDRPGFEAAWRDRLAIPIQGRPVPTLSLAHALEHLAAHALDDRWGELRALVDLVRLMRLRGEALQQDLCKRPAVALAWAVAVTLLEVRLPGPGDPTRLSRRQRWAVDVARKAQREPLFLHQRGPWRLNRAWDLWYQRVALSRSPQDWLRSAAAYALPPAAFNDPCSGEDRSLAAALASRLGRVQERLRP
ncbi:MAG: nucleotidyltransferase family protein [Cyanobium sp. CZS 25K]|nr:nucleotidyltransferase family protein [Cyanobium sp. CZS25K]